MTLIHQAYEMLYDDKMQCSAALKYSGRFSDYNANGSYNRWKNHVEIRLSRKWQQVDDEIVIGCIQELLVKLFGRKKSSFNIDLYNNFVRHLHIAIPKTKIEPELAESFFRVNQKYFFGMMETPNLIFGKPAMRQLGSYNYKTDTVIVSSIFKGEQKLIDYIMYHELLHKKHKFSSGGRYHTKAFKDDERTFENFANINALLDKHIRKFKRRKILGW